MFGYGISYAIASLSCTIAPFLAVTGAGLRSDSVLGALSVYVAYAAGFTLVVGVLAVAAALSSAAVADRMRRIVPYVNRISGVLLVVVGLYVAYYGLYEVRLFTANGSPDDSVIAAAGRLQGAIAGWVHRHGAWPWLVALALLLVAALARRGARRLAPPRNVALQIGPRRATNHSDAGERRRHEPDEDAHHARSVGRRRRRSTSHVAVLDHEHADRFGPRPTHLGDRESPLCRRRFRTAPRTRVTRRHPAATCRRRRGPLAGSCNPAYYTARTQRRRLSGDCRRSPRRRPRPARRLPIRMRRRGAPGPPRPGCLDFALSADLVEPGRINIFERWESQARSRHSAAVDPATSRARRSWPRRSPSTTWRPSGTSAERPFPRGDDYRNRALSSAASCSAA